MRTPIYNISPQLHPRAESLRSREMLSQSLESGLLVPQGLIAYGRGEAFDYLFGERTIPAARIAIRAAAARIILADRPVISVNGNVASVAAKGVARLSKLAGADVEINLFYRNQERIRRISGVLRDAGIRDVLGVDPAYQRRIPELSSERRRVDSRGIMKADVVVIPLEDGDRTESLRKMGKLVIAVDLNPLSRTSKSASISIVDDIVRVIPQMIDQIRYLNRLTNEEIHIIATSFNNSANLRLVLSYLTKRISRLSTKRQGRK